MKMEIYEGGREREGRRQERDKLLMEKTNLAKFHLIYSKCARSSISLYHCASSCEALLVKE